MEWISVATGANFKAKDLAYLLCASGSDPTIASKLTFYKSYVKIFLETSERADLGHGWNHTMDMHVSNEGYVLRRALNSSPEGDKHNTICSLSLTFPIK